MKNTLEELKKARLNLAYSVSKPRLMGEEDDAAAWDGHADMPRTGRLDSGADRTPPFRFHGWNERNPAGFGQYHQDSLPSRSVAQAKEYLQGAMESRPNAYQSRYTRQIADLYDRVMNKNTFKYDAAKDPLFASYKNQYTQEGQRAMQDAMGTAAALTGGYGNSWGATAGYQAYQWYLQQLNNVIPQLAQDAFNEYKYFSQAQDKSADGSGYAMSDWQSGAAGRYGWKKGLDAWDSARDDSRNKTEMENRYVWPEQNIAGRTHPSGFDGASQTEDEHRLRQYERMLNQMKRMNGQYK